MKSLEKPKPHWPDFRDEVRLFLIRGYSLILLVCRKRKLQVQSRIYLQLMMNFIKLIVNRIKKHREPQKKSSGIEKHYGPAIIMFSNKRGLMRIISSVYSAK